LYDDNNDNDNTTSLPSQESAMANFPTHKMPPPPPPPPPVSTTTRIFPWNKKAGGAWHHTKPQKGHGGGEYADYVEKTPLPLLRYVELLSSGQQLMTAGFVPGKLYTIFKFRPDHFCFSELKSETFFDISNRQQAVEEFEGPDTGVIANNEVRAEIIRGMPMSGISEYTQAQRVAIGKPGFIFLYTGVWFSLDTPIISAAGEQVSGNHYPVFLWIDVFKRGHQQKHVVPLPGNVTLAEAMKKSTNQRKEEEEEEEEGMKRRSVNQRKDGLKNKDFA
jgi:hypothetical protein